MSACTATMESSAHQCPPLQRHQLAWLSSQAWEQVLAKPWDEVSGACLMHWCHHGLPLVVTTQASPGLDHEHMALGLPAPLQWQRRRMSLMVLRSQAAKWGAFPELNELCKHLPEHQRPAWQALADDLKAMKRTARVHGSHGWQLLTQLACVRKGSDIDVTVSVDGLASADVVAARLHQSHGPEMPIDGELVWPDGRAVSWREWQAWRAGRVKSILVKHIHGHRLLGDANQFEHPHFAEQMP
jgi:phosphoribosyl-dephospho-CoA transferase